MFWGNNLPKSCCGLTHYNISVLKHALNCACQLCLAVNESKGSFCYKLLFPKMLLQRGSETLLDLECSKSRSCQWLILRQLKCLQELIRPSKIEDGPLLLLCFPPTEVLLWSLNRTAFAAVSLPDPALWWWLGHRAEDNHLNFCIKCLGTASAHSHSRHATLT